MFRVPCTIGPDAGNVPMSDFDRFSTTGYARFRVAAKVDACNKP